MGWDAPWHWVILAIVVIALFGYKKLPDASRALGRSLRIFKAEIKGMTEDDQARANAKAQPAEIVPPQHSSTPAPQPPAASDTPPASTQPVPEAVQQPAHNPGE
ncbi:MAG TPA: Sec-independent protein translocase subunit TatA [Jatrophihabitantaceae bacterium]|jgi:sec-independent protein translocase protein TatA